MAEVLDFISFHDCVERVEAVACLTAMARSLDPTAAIHMLTDGYSRRGRATLVDRGDRCYVIAVVGV